ncbi:MAG TPA: hypothetical protein DEA78_22970, partial [Cyanobacteria bacterium UBA11159]|nr:hypothetical protein [Cyanobacteria bacterium UBA11159]
SKVTDNNNSIIGYINICSEQLNTTPTKSKPTHPKLQQRNNNQTNMETIDKLRQFGLSDEQIAEALELPLEVVKQVGVEE